MKQTHENDMYLQLKIMDEKYKLHDDLVLPNHFSVCLLHDDNVHLLILYRGTIQCENDT